MRRKLTVGMVDHDERFIHNGAEWRFVNLDFSAPLINIEALSDWDFENIHVAMNLDNGIIREFPDDMIVEQDGWI